LFDERGLRAGEHSLDDGQRAGRRLRHQAFESRERELFGFGGDAFLVLLGNRGRLREGRPGHRQRHQHDA
jgi:hypothetical protein